MTKKKQFEHSDEQKRAERIYGRICCCILVAGVVSAFVHWWYLLYAFGFLLWNAYFYEKGCMEWVCDEYEQDGYPTQGVRRIFQSWITLAVLALVALLFMKFGAGPGITVLVLGALAFILYLIFF